MASSADRSDAREHEFSEVRRAENAPSQHLELEDLKKLRLCLTADLGQCSMLVRDVLELAKGSVVPLNKVAGESTDIYVGGLPVAKGEVVVIGDALHVRIAEILGVEEHPNDEGSIR